MAGARRDPGSSAGATTGPAPPRVAAAPHGLRALGVREGHRTGPNKGCVGCSGLTGLCLGSFGCSLGGVWAYWDAFGFVWFYSDHLCPEAVPVALSRCPPCRPRPRPAATAAAPRPRPGPRRRGAPCPEQPWRQGRLAAPLPTLKMAARGLARRRRPSAMATASLPLIGCARRGRRRVRHADWLPVLKMAARELPAPADCSARGQNGGGRLRRPQLRWRRTRSGGRPPPRPRRWAAARRSRSVRRRAAGRGARRSSCCGAASPPWCGRRC